MKKGNKITAFLSSMRFGLILLVLVLAACVAGSLITQGESASYYAQTYPAWFCGIITALRLDDVFHSPWFLVLTGLLCLNLIGCSVLHFPQYLRQMKGFTAQNAETWEQEAELSLQQSPERLFNAMGLRKSVFGKDSQGRRCLYGVRNRAGVWGAWLTHVGILVIILGFALGQIYTVKYTVYGVPGQTKAVEGTEYDLTIDTFDIGLREDATVTQYTSLVTLTDRRTGEQESAETSVNHPAKLFGMKVYQNSTGWAADVNVYKENELVQTEIVCAGEYTTVEAVEGLYVVFRAFYPDYVTVDGKPATASGSLNNPAYLYMLYYGDQVLGMNTLKQGEKITVDDLTITFEDPRPYSLLQLKQDPFTGIAAAGGVILMLAMLLAFYVRTEELYALETEAGSWSVYARSRKGGLLFKEKLQEKAAALRSLESTDRK